MKRGVCHAHHERKLLGSFPAGIYFNDVHDAQANTRSIGKEYEREEKAKESRHNHTHDTEQLGAKRGHGASHGALKKANDIERGNGLHDVAMHKLFNRSLHRLQERIP